MENQLTFPIFVLAVLCFNIALTEWLVRRTLLRHVGTALLVIVLTAATSNLGLIPTGSGENPIYQGIFNYVAPFAIFLPLLEVNLRDVIRAGGPMIGSFAAGALGTFAAVPAAMWAVGGKEAIGPLFSPLGGMFVGTYTGGSVNFNALALHYDFVKEGELYVGTVAVDSIITALWMVACIAIPRLIGASRASEPEADGTGERWVEADTAKLHPLELAILGGLGAVSLWLSETVAGWLSGWGVNLPSVLILTTIALILAQFSAIRSLRAVRPLSLFAIYLFLAVIGAYCDLSALVKIGPLGLTLFLFATLTVAIHGAVTFSAGRLFSRDWSVLAVASQANIGGPASALALARSLGRSDLLLPAVLVGTLGYGVGTYLGFAAAEYVLIW